MTSPFRCFLVGADSLLIECGEILLARGHRIAGVVSASPRVAEWAASKDIEAIDERGDWGARLGAEPFDLLFAITHLALIPEALLALPSKAAINFHDGPLPRYAGLNAPAWALMAGESEYGITWHEMTAGVDAGRILKQVRFELAPEETSLTLNAKCFEAALESFGALLDELAGGRVQAVEQDAAQRSYFGKNQRPDAACALDWTQPADELEALVRALDFGRYRNPLGSPKLVHDGRAWIVTSAELGEAPGSGTPGSGAPGSGAPGSGAPGTLLAADADGLEVACGEGSLLVRGLAELDGRALALADFLASTGLAAGDALRALGDDERARLTAWNAELCRAEEKHVRALETLEAIELPQTGADDPAPADGAHASASVAVPDAFRARFAGPDALTAAVLAYLGRAGGKDGFHVGWSDAALLARSRGFEALVSPRAPLAVELDAAAPFATSLERIAKTLERARKRGSFLREVFARYPELHGRPDPLSGGALSIAVEQLAHTDDHEPRPGDALTAVVGESADAVRLVADPARVSAATLEVVQRQLGAFLANLAASPDAPLAELDFFSAAERQRVLFGWNETDAAFRADACVHELFEEQVDRTPDAVAAVFEGAELTYRELDERANRLASHLRALSVGPATLVGVHVERSLDLVVSILAVLKAGGAYVPLDPDFPADRIAFMVEDARVPVVLTQDARAAELPPSAAQLVRVDSDWAAIAKQPATRPRSGAGPADLAYVIYTSGSTGRPKGVMVEHQNAVNFFTGMDERVPHAPPGVWLAVTSLSFDISVLELLWTLTRGFEVVVYKDRERAGSGSASSSKPMDFGLFLWGNDDGPGPAKYELMLAGARFGDAHGFSSIWTPERHFHAFGGPYPNPSVTSAAIAAVTSRIGIRAGSCVSPLHHPIRIAEEWAVVDNISNGRVGISFASGWQPDDFVLRPETFKDNKAEMFRNVETVRRLWRGETLEFDGPLGKAVPRSTLPRPIQPELPVWVTSAGNPETYRQAGAAGANVLTHLLGQSVKEVAQKIAIYRQARAEAGHDPAAGVVTLMLHAFIGDDEEQVREVVRGPMKRYLASATNLVKQYAWSFPAFKRPEGSRADLDSLDLDGLTEEEWDAMMEHAFQRYFETSGLFGTPESCQDMVDELKAVGVDEIGCLIDFGIDKDTVLAHLEHLNRARELANAGASAATTDAADAARGDGADRSLAAQLREREVTHMQCTPSMARMLLLDERARGALGSLQHLLLGGEALPPSLVRELAEVTSASITNMYGPTETTIWSSTHPVDPRTGDAAIGRPIANTRLYVLDERRRPVPPGVAGELWIGGAGVVRGYHERPELTAERFLPDPFRGGAERMYRTGDLARFRADGVVEFLGRADHQVKIRGYRIELGEIEAVLAEHPSVRECVVIAREDVPGDQRLVAYAVPEARALDGAALREHLRHKLPEYMVPAHFVALERMPLTPNAKIDRKALPAPDAAQAAQAEYVAPSGELEGVVAALWQDVLGIEKVGTRDNFFDIGGHSLLVVRLHRSLAEVVDRPLSLTDLYRFPTIESLVSYLESDGRSDSTQKGSDRAKLRKSMRRRRARS